MMLLLGPLGAALCAGVLIAVLDVTTGVDIALVVICVIGAYILGLIAGSGEA
jgi:hypothetical protein